MKTEPFHSITLRFKLRQHLSKFLKRNKIKCSKKTNFAVCETLTGFRDQIELRSDRKTAFEMKIGERRVRMLREVVSLCVFLVWR